MSKYDYRILINANSEPIITVPFRKKQLELIYNILYEKVDNLRDEFTEENRNTNIRTQTELMRVNRKLNYALQELIKFRGMQGDVMTFERFRQMIQELKQKKARCSQYCSCWDSEDRDCEIYGEQHVPPSRCQWYLEREAKRIDEREER